MIRAMLSAVFMEGGTHMMGTAAPALFCNQESQHEFSKFCDDDAMRVCVRRER
jgi:hypothetical protein